MTVQCRVTRKICHSKTDAKRAAEKLRRWDEDPKAPIGIYKCAECRRWHVGHDKYAVAYE